MGEGLVFLGLAGVIGLLAIAVAIGTSIVTGSEDNKKMREDLKQALATGESGKLGDFLALWGDKVPPKMRKQVEQRQKEHVRPTAWDKLNQD